MTGILDCMGRGEGVASALLAISPEIFRGFGLATKLAVEIRSLGKLFFLITGIKDPVGLSLTTLVTFS